MLTRKLQINTNLKSLFLMLLVYLYWMFQQRIPVGIPLRKNNVKNGTIERWKSILTGSKIWPGELKEEKEDQEKEQEGQKEDLYEQ